jgi:methyltransferase family protein
MADSNPRYRARLAFNSLVKCVPRGCLSGFLRSFELIQSKAEEAGYNVYPKRYDTPFPQREEMDRAGLQARRLVPGIDLNPDRAVQLLALLQPFCVELQSIPFDKTDDCLFWFNNLTFTEFDSAVLHGMLRHLRPRRYVELGCGFSSYISSRALKRNADAGQPCEAVYADPAPRHNLDKIVAYGRVIQKRVQDLPTDLFTKLEAGDVLFIDTSHVLKLQSDVVCELVSILPALRAGVWIHLHDVFTPYDYPEDWLTKPMPLTYNEQYGVECLLSGGDRFRVELPLFMLWKERFEVLKPLVPGGRTRAHSFWVSKQH